jgi:hypothetical protein
MSQKNPKKPFTPFDSWLDEYQKVATMEDIPKEAFPPIDVKVDEETKETIVELKVEGCELPHRKQRSFLTSSFQRS